MQNVERKSFAQTKLPWVIAALAVALYLVTLNRWLSLCSLSNVFTLTDPSATAPFTGPLHYLVSLPIRWLPTHLQLLGFNALSALFAALTLALLARSVSLLPHDRTREERHRQTDAFALLGGRAAWLPPVLAAAVCGLQFTFWQHATAATGEMLDLLLFAYVVRCLLEYRAGERESWLYRLAFVYGIATANNWAMIGFFPLALASVLWLRGRLFFQKRFFVRMTLLGLAGLLLYLLLPTLQALQPDAGASFWQSLRLELAYQKNLLRSVPRLITLFAALTSIVPIVVLSIRWPSTSGDTSALGTLLAQNVFRVIYSILFLAGLWVALDAPFSARALLDSLLIKNRLTEVSLPFSFLSFHYLGALAIGYFAGYFLIVFGSPEERSRRHAPRGVTSMVSNAALSVLLAAGFTATLFLAWRNLPAIRASNGQILRDYAELVLQPVPQNHALLLADNPSLLAVVQTLLNQRNAPRDLLLSNSRVLEFASVQRQLNERAPNLWPAVPADAAADTRMAQDLLSAQLARTAATNPVFYLHPSFGYFFEASFLIPNGLNFSLVPYPTNSTTAPPPPAATLEAISSFWKAQAPRLAQLEPAIRQNVPDALMVGRWYALALNANAVFLQRASTNQLQDASELLRWARRLNPHSLIAEINLAHNDIRRGTSSPRNLITQFNERFNSQYRNWTDAISRDGPIDEPSYCREFAASCLSHGLSRQATIEYLRALAFDPTDQAARIGLANCYGSVKLFDLALATLRDVELRQASHPLNPQQKASVLRVHAASLKGKGNVAAAEQLLLDALRDDPASTPVLATLIEFYEATDETTKALNLITQQLQSAKDPVPLLLTRTAFLMKARQYQDASVTLTQVLARDPDNRQALLRQGAIGIQTTNYVSAIPPLTRLLELEPENQPARLNRAIAQLQAGQLDAALEDYEALLPALNDVYSVHFGLGEIAWRRKNNATAIQHYEAYLRLAPPESAEARSVASRLQDLKATPK